VGHDVVGRYYDPATGQFLSVDPIVQQTQQAYEYAGDDAVNQLDPNGDGSVSSKWTRAWNRWMKLLCRIGLAALLGCGPLSNTYNKANAQSHNQDQQVEIPTAEERKGWTNNWWMFKQTLIENMGKPLPGPSVLGSGLPGWLGDAVKRLGLGVVGTAVVVGLLDLSLVAVTA
jgi:hypothetical protein